MIKLLWIISIVFLLISCSNSEYITFAETTDCPTTESDCEIKKDAGLSLKSSDSEQVAENCTISQEDDYIPLDDSEYPYAGLPRIVIETENAQKIKDRETEIPARLQVWGKDSPESTIMKLTIRGRGNTTWSYPKKPYAIKFENKESFLGMPSAKKWVLLANYRDRTLMRNAVAFELARKTSLVWTPNGKFAEVFLNGKYIGCYFVCEKIEIKKNRLELNENAFLLEFDTSNDTEYRFITSINNLPVNIKQPKDIDSASFCFIQDYIDLIELSLQQDANSLEYQKYLNQESFADYFIVYAMANNREPWWPKSVFMHKDNYGKLAAGPVWDFDWATFDIKKNGLTNWDVAIYKKLTEKKSFRKTIKNRWSADRPEFDNIFGFVDSLANYTANSNSRNTELWPIKIEKGLVGDEDKSFEESIDMLKKCIRKRINELDSLINLL